MATGLCKVPKPFSWVGVITYMSAYMYTLYITVKFADNTSTA